MEKVEKKIRNIKNEEQTLEKTTVSCVFDYGEHGLLKKRITIPYTDRVSIERELKKAYRDGVPAPAGEKTELPECLDPEG